MTGQEATTLVELAACPDHRRVGPNPPHVNETGCVITVSHISGDVLCRWPGPDCDCLMQRIDESYKEEA